MKTYQIIQIGMTKVFTYTYHEEYGQTLDDAAKFFNEIIEESNATKKEGLRPWTKDLYIVNGAGDIITEYHSYLDGTKPDSLPNQHT